MARKRMIDPSIWTDEGMAELTARQQLLYIGMISNADDDGRLKGSESALRLILPTLYAGLAMDEIAGDVDAVLTSMRQLVRYECEGRVYIAFRNYRQWQKIDKPSPSILPPPPDKREDSTSPPRTVVESSPVPPLPFAPNRIEEKGKEEKRTEGKGSAPASAPPRPPADAPTPAPRRADARPTLPTLERFVATLDAWATERGVRAILEAEAERFRDYCLSGKNGKPVVYADYYAACRKWITNPHYAHSNGSAARASPTSHAPPLNWVERQQQQGVAALIRAGEAIDQRRQQR